MVLSLAIQINIRLVTLLSVFSSIYLRRQRNGMGFVEG